MVKPRDIIKATGSDPTQPISGKNPLGTGHNLHVGRVFQCASQHVLMTLLSVPLDGQELGVVPAERADEASWELDPAQEAMDPTNPVCMICGQPPVI